MPDLCTAVCSRFYGRYSLCGHRKERIPTAGPFREILANKCVFLLFSEISYLCAIYLSKLKVSFVVQHIRDLLYTIYIIISGISTSNTEK